MTRASDREAARREARARRAERRLFAAAPTWPRTSSSGRRRASCAAAAIAELEVLADQRHRRAELAPELADLAEGSRGPTTSSSR